MSVRAWAMIVAVVAAVGALCGWSAWKMAHAGRLTKPPLPPAHVPALVPPVVAPWPDWPARPTTFIRDLDKSEDTFDHFNADIKSAFLKGLKTGDRGMTLGALTGDFRGSFPTAADGTVVPDVGLSIREFQGPPAPAAGGADFLALVLSHLGGIVQVERASFRTFEFLADPAGNRARVRGHFQLAGSLPDRGRRDLQAIVNGEAVVADGKWKWRRLGLESGCLIENARPPFVDVTDAVGFSFNESEENRLNAQKIIDARAIKTAGGLSCYDANGDGYWDILASFANRESVLFLNDGRGGFIRAPAPSTKPEESPFHFLVVDLDGDGVPEAVSTQVLSYEGTQATLGLYTMKSGAWAPVPGGLKFTVAPGVREVMFQALAACDVDGDGRLDVFVGGYSNNTSGHEKFNAVAAYDGADNLLFMNHGGLQFTEESDAHGIHGTQYTLAAKFFDFDFDGDQDLFECNDFGPNILWANDGKGHFHEVKDSPMAKDSAYTMGVTVADWDNTGDWTVHVSNMYSHAGNRIVPLAEGIRDDLRQVAMVLARGNAQFEHDSKTGQWRETSVERGVNWADWAWSCNFFDFDNDGDKDLFVTNGYTSNADASAPDW